MPVSEETFNAENVEKDDEEEEGPATAAKKEKDPDSVIEEQLLQPRSWFPSNLEAVHSLLVPSLDLQPVLGGGDIAWLEDLARLLRGWVDLIVTEIADRRFKHTHGAQ